MTEPSASGEAMRWAMVGAGLMLRLIGADMTAADSITPQVLVTRDHDRARAAAAEHGFAEGTADLDRVLQRGDIDVVYVATPHSEHSWIARAALDAGKHVLVEKPMTTSAAETQALCDYAAKRGLFLMEALWTSFLPAVLDLQRRGAHGEIGRPTSLSASFTFAPPHDPTHRLWDPARAGGTTLDQGVYPLSLAHLLFGEPQSIRASGSVQHGVDVEAVAELRHTSGARSVCTSSMLVNGSTNAVLHGEEGSFELPGPFWGADRLIIRGLDGTVTEEVHHPPQGGRYGPMLRAVSTAIAAGLTEHPLRSHAESVAVARSMDEVRAQVWARACG